jgi:hypothetical protein
MRLNVPPFKNAKLIESLSSRGSRFDIDSVLFIDVVLAGNEWHPRGDASGHTEPVSRECSGGECDIRGASD